MYFCSRRSTSIARLDVHTIAIVSPTNECQGLVRNTSPPPQLQITSKVKYYLVPISVIGGCRIAKAKGDSTPLVSSHGVATVLGLATRYLLVEYWFCIQSVYRG